MADTKEAKEGRPKRDGGAQDLAADDHGRRSTSTEQKRLQALGQRVEALWALAQRRLEIAESEIRRHIDVWGADDLPVGTGAVQREQIEASLTRPEQRVPPAAPGDGRLGRAVVLAAHRRASMPPTREQWIGALEALLGTMSRTEARQGRGMFAGDLTWAELDDAEHNEAAFAQMKPVAEVLAAHPWLGVCEQIAEKEGFFHWELDFAPVFAQRGGFDLQVGNPPWVRPDWDDALVLAEDDAWFGLADKPAVRDP